MAAKSIDIIISTVLRKTGITAAAAAMKALGRTVARNLANIHAGFMMAGRAVASFTSLLAKGMKVGSLAAQFKPLIGSLEDAKRHVEDLRELGRTPPFSLDQFAAASQQMMKMSGGMLGFKEDLKLAGDAAAATGSSLEAVSHAVGFAYQAIRDGQGFGRAGMQLANLGVLTKAQVAHFDELTRSGKSNAEVWAEFQKELEKFSGAMEDQEKTAKGSMESIKGEIDNAMTNVSAVIAEKAKPAMDGLLAWLKRIQEDGTLDEWADGCVSAFERFCEGAKWVGSAIGSAFKAVSTFGEMVGTSIGTMFGTLSAGGSLKDAIVAADAETRKVYDENYGERADELKERSRQRAKERAEEKAAEDAKRKEEHDRKRREDMERAERERLEAEREAVEKKATEEAEKEAKKRADAESKAYEDALKEREAVERRAAADMAREELKAKMDGIRKAHDAQMDALDAEARRIDDNIAKLRAMGAANPMAMAGGGVHGNGTLDQAALARGERQAARDEERFDKARKSLERRMRRAGIDPDGDLKDVGALGRLSNLDRATLERLRLDRANKAANDLEKKKIKLAEDTKKRLDDIAAQLTAVGL